MSSRFVGEHTLAWKPPTECVRRVLCPACVCPRTASWRRPRPSMTWPWSYEPIRSQVWLLCSSFLSTRTHQIDKKVSKYRTAFYYILSVSVVFEKSEVNLKSNVMILRQQSTYSPQQDLRFPHVRKVFAALEKNLTIFEVWRSSIPGHRLTSTWQRGWWFLGSPSLRRQVPASDAGSHGLHLHAGIIGKVNNGIPELCSGFSLDLKATERSVKRSCG